MSSIDKLKKRVESNREHREDDKKLYEHLTARERLVAEAPLEQEMDFYCPTCNKHQSLLGRKAIVYGLDLDKNEDYLFQPITASFRSRCPKGHYVRRYITDAKHDPYFKSPILRRLAYEMRDEMLQPNDPRFRKVYPKQWEEFERQKEENEKYALYGG